MSNDGIKDIKIPIRFRRRPHPVTPDYRPGWKISLLLLILHLASRGGKSSLTRLHVLNWAVRTARHQEEFSETLSSKAPLFAFNVRFEPAFSRAIDLAAAARLVDWIGGSRICLTHAGEEIARKIKKNGTALRPEISFLEKVGKSITEPQALGLAKGADIV